MIPTRHILATAVSRAAGGPAAGLGVQVATVLALAAAVVSTALIWLTLSRPLEVVGALAGHDGWHIAVALGRLLAGTAGRLAAWL